MTETTNHRAPLAPGEIRTRTVGNRTFRVMHVAGGSFTQASVSDPTWLGASQVLATNRFESFAVAAYADAIEQAESDAAGEVDAPSFADDVAALLTQYGTLCAEVAVQRDDRLAVEPFDRAQAIRREILDRIAAQVPVRATDSGMPLWLHDCGWSRGGQIVPSYCNGCRTHGKGEWRALYTLGGAA